MNMKLSYLPLGSIHPKGFIKEQLERSKRGMGGNLPKIEPGMIAYPYIKKTKITAVEWGDGDQSGWGAEISGSYYCALCMLAYTLNDKELISEFEAWVNALLARQREDGYLGTYDGPNSDPYEDFNAWGNAHGMKALLYYYEVTGREDVFYAVYRCMKWFCRVWEGDHKTSYAGIYITEPMMYCYNITGDRELLDFCIDYQRYQAEHDLTFNSYKAMLSDDFIYNSQHTVAYCAQMHLPALVYEGCGDKLFLQSAIKGIDKLNQKGVHITGAPVSVNEYLGPVSSTHESEHCNFLFYSNACAQMARITGDARYSDMIERTVYNGAEGARKKDERAIAYLSAPNQIYATNESSKCYSNHQVYSPCHPVACCPVNSVGVIPNFVRTSVMTDDENGIYIFSYCPSTVDNGKWKIDEETNYPFDDTVTLNVRGEGTVYLRRPSFAKKMSVTVDGKRITAKVNGKGFIPVGVSGEKKIVISFGFDIEVVKVDDSDGADKHPMAVIRGPLVFALPIKERWDPYFPRTETPLTKDWPWFNVTPEFTEANVRDNHERVILRRYQTGWNVCIDENIKPSDIKIERKSPDGYFWENSPITLTVPAYRAPYMCAPYPTRTFEPFGKTQKTGEELTLKLVPYGCTNLRITYFPRASFDK